MSKRCLLRWSLLLIILAAFAVWLEPTRVVWGWLRGETFYQGRPTSWWRAELERWYCFDVITASNATVRSTKSRWYRKSDVFEEYFPRIFPRNATEPPFMHGDPMAKEVLLEILQQPYDGIRIMSFQDGPMFRVLAKEALKKIDEKLGQATP